MIPIAFIFRLLKNRICMVLMRYKFKRELIMKNIEAVSVSEAQKIIGIKRTKIYQLLGSGELKALKCGSRTIILKSEIQSFLGKLKPYLTESEVTMSNNDLSPMGQLAIKTAEQGIVL